MSGVNGEPKSVQERLQEQLARYRPHSELNSSSPESIARQRMLGLLTEGTHCFDRGTFPAHFTGSAWILSPDRSSTLLIHHRKLGRWMQAGGHADGNPDLWAVALREAREETGAALSPEGEGIFDIDIHSIPARGDDPAHEHFDVRYLFVSTSLDLVPETTEVHDAQWVPLGEVSKLTQEESVLRMVRKTGY